MRISRPAGVGIAAALLAATLAAPTAAHAERYVVWAGASGIAPAGTPAGATLDQFFPAKLVVHEGDTVTFRAKGRATATFLGTDKLSKYALLRVGVPTTRYTGIKDFAGEDFHFADSLVMQYNPVLVRKSGTSIMTSPLLPHSTGLLSAKGVTYTFKKAGTFAYVNAFAPSMKGSIVVAPDTTDVATRAEIDAAALKSQKAAFALTKGLTKIKAPANTVFVGVGKTGMSLMAFQPSKLTVKAGASVRFLAYDPYAFHSVVFGDRAWAEDFFNDTDQFPNASGSPNQVSPAFISGSDPNPPTGTPFLYSDTLHGNGFWASKGLDMSTSTGTFPQSADISFPEAGTYTYFCGVHGEMMSGTIKVVD